MEEKIKFEEALGELEKIVKKLEQGGLPLEESLEAFERGMKLSKFCFNKLNEAQRKIEILIKDEKTGEITTKPFSLEENYFRNKNLEEIPPKDKDIEDEDIEDEDIEDEELPF